MRQSTIQPKVMGQGMTEYIIVVALIAVAAIGVYSAFGDVLRGQTSVAAVGKCQRWASAAANCSGVSISRAAFGISRMTAKLSDVSKRPAPRSP